MTDPTHDPALDDPALDDPALDDPALDDLGFAVVDLDRERRQGLPEIVYGPGKTTDEIVAIVTSLLAGCQGPVLVSRVEAGTAAAVLDAVAGGPTTRARGCWSGGPARPGGSPSPWSARARPTDRSPARRPG